MSSVSIHIIVTSKSAQKRIEMMHVKKRLIENCVTAKDYQALKNHGIEFANPFTLRSS